MASEILVKACVAMLITFSVVATFNPTTITAYFVALGVGIVIGALPYGDVRK